MLVLEKEDTWGRMAVWGNWTPGKCVENLESKRRIIIFGDLKIPPRVHFSVSKRWRVSEKEDAWSP